ncbi:MAG: PilZ domain-containing protein [Hyphococcus sp.]
MSQRGFGKRAAEPGAKPARRLKRPTDKRASDRETAFKNAKLYVAGQLELACAVRDLSDKGCMVTLPGAENLPGELVIKLGLAYPRRRARVVWRKNMEAGLEFLPDV